VSAPESSGASAPFPRWHYCWTLRAGSRLSSPRKSGSETNRATRRTARVCRRRSRGAPAPSPPATHSRRFARVVTLPPASSRQISRQARNLQQYN